MMQVSRTMIAILAGVLLSACQSDAEVDSPSGVLSAEIQPELHLAGPGVIKKRFKLEYPEASRFIVKGIRTDDGRCQALPREVPLSKGKPYMEVEAEVNPDTCESLIIVVDLPSDYQLPPRLEGMTTHTERITFGDQPD